MEAAPGKRHDSRPPAVGRLGRYAWNLWDYDWKIPGPGKYSLAVRAKDDKGRLQPAERASERVDPYEWNAWQRISVTVT